MKSYKANNSLTNRVNTYIRNITNDPTRINPTVSIENPEMNYHLTLSNSVKLGLVTLITATTFLTGCFTAPVENYGPTKPILDSPANKQVFITEKDKKKIDFKWKESVIYQILEDENINKGDTKSIEYTLRIDNDKDMSSPEHEVKTSDLEAAVEVAKGVNYWLVGAKIVTENSEKCFYLEPEQNYSDEEVLSEIREFDIQKIVIPPPVTDTDGDGIEDSVDNCPNTYNPDQSDWDDDGIGTVCDPDEIPPPPF